MKLQRSLFPLFFFIAVILFNISCLRQNDSGNNTEEKESPVSAKMSPKTIEVEVMGESVRIGEQIWMRTNLQVARFQNGDTISIVTSNPEWQKLGDREKPAAGYYLNDPDYADKYGLIYNWYAVSDPGGLCPEGWRIPSLEDWETLIDYLGGREVAGAYLKDSLGWMGDGNGNNLSGFEGLPGGFRGYDGISYSAGYMARWWTSTEQSTYFAYGFDINYDQASINQSTGYKQDGFSVRCIKE